jgi:hypothetical protein
MNECGIDRNPPLFKDIFQAEKAIGSAASATSTYTTERISHCLAPCAECNGEYESAVPKKHFLCACDCHTKGLN